MKKMCVLGVVLAICLANGGTVLGNLIVTLDPYALREVANTRDLNDRAPWPNVTYLRTADLNYIVAAEFDISSYSIDAAGLVNATLDFGFSPLYGPDGQLHVSQVPSDLQITGADYDSSNLAWLLQEDGTHASAGHYTLSVTDITRIALLNAGTAQGLAFRFRDVYVGAQTPPVGGGEIQTPKLTLEFVPEPMTLALVGLGGLLLRKRM